MITLAVDTSTDVRAGVARDGVTLASAAVTDPRAHAEQLMPLVTSVLDEAGLALADVDEIVAGVGPGPFTGLRVGVVTATTLGLALRRPVRGVCSLDAVARQWVDAGAPERFAVVSDARRKEVYWAVYSTQAAAAGVPIDGASCVRVDGPFVTSPPDVPNLPLAGPGARLVRPDAEGPAILDAGILAARASTLPDAGLEPLYLRRPDAELPSAPKTTIPQPRIALRRVR